MTLPRRVWTWACLVVALGSAATFVIARTIEMGPRVQLMIYRGWATMDIAIDPPRIMIGGGVAVRGVRFEPGPARPWPDAWLIAGIVGVRLPMWIPLFAGGMAAWALWRREIRSRRGGCRVCGYDLSGTPSGMPCPECGK